MEKLNEVIFYTIDKAIRSYRVYAQKQLRKAGYTITIDQWLIIKSILENPGITQHELGERVFKDKASVTRIIELLVKAKYLERLPYANDRLRFSLVVTAEGEQIINQVQEVVLQNRITALQGIDPKDITLVNKVLENIIENCTR